MRKYINEILEYLRKYPALMSEIMEMHQCYDLNRLRNFFDELDFTKPYTKTPKHKNYLRHEETINKILLTERSYTIKIDKLDQNYMDDSHTQSVYNNSAEVYDEVVNSFWPFGRKESMDTLNPVENEKILEVGAGTGSNFKYYPEYCSVVAIDFTEGMIRLAETEASRYLKKNIYVRSMDVHKMSFPDDYFDKVYSFYALCTVRNPLRAMKEIKRVCKSGGTIVMFEPVESSIKDVSVIQYLFQPVGRQMGHIWIENFPAYVVPYNSTFKCFDILKELGLEIEYSEIYDPPFNIVHLIKCRNGM